MRYRCHVDGCANEATHHVDLNDGQDRLACMDCIERLGLAIIRLRNKFHPRNHYRLAMS